MMAILSTLLNNAENPMKKYLCAALFVPILCWAGADPIDCPSTLDVKSSANPPAGWQVANLSAVNALDRVGFYSGPPAERASLVPDRTQNKKGESQDTWLFSPNAPEAIWVACFYTGTTLIVAKEVEHGVKSCSVRYKTTRSGSRLSVIEGHCNSQ
jgi:hypothetical protein